MDHVRDVAHYGKKDEEETSKQPPKPKAEVSSKEPDAIANGVNFRQVGA